MAESEVYFARADTPSVNSPVGSLMVKVLGKFPNITFDEARVKANSLLNEAAGKRIYRIPPPLTDAEIEARRKAMKARFASKALPKAAYDA
ncbi:MAG TPA: hypothetical protein VGH37_05550 [Candidatus Acidoferrum sp.]